MNGNEILFSDKVFALYSQVALFDAENRNSYPQWKAGHEIIVFSLQGVAVVTASDEQVDVIVCKGKVIPKYALCVSGEILVGEQGILVGNIPAATVTQIPLESGRYSVVVFTDGFGTETRQVYFFLDRLDRK